MVIYNDDDVILLLKKLVFTVNAKPFDNYAPLQFAVASFVTLRSTYSYCQRF